MFQKLFRMVPVISGSLTRNTDVFTRAILSSYMRGRTVKSPVPTRSTLQLERSSQPSLTIAISYSHWLPCRIPQRFPITNIKDKGVRTKIKLNTYKIPHHQPLLPKSVVHCLACSVKQNFLTRRVFPFLSSGGERATDLPLVLPGSFFQSSSKQNICNIFHCFVYPMLNIRLLSLVEHLGSSLDSHSSGSGTKPLFLLHSPKSYTKENRAIFKYNFNDWFHFNGPYNVYRNTHTVFILDVCEADCTSYK